MSSPTFEYMSESQLLAEARIELNITNSTADNLLLRRYLKQCLKELRTPLMFRRNEETIQVYNDTFDLPPDFVRFDKTGSLFIENGSATMGDGPLGTYPDAGNNAFYTGAPGNTNTYTHSLYQINGNTVYFRPNSGITEVKIVYTAVALGPDGLLLVPSNYERAIVSYIKWKYAQTFFREFQADIRAEFFSEWRNSKRYLKGLENLQNQQDRELNNIVMNRMIL